jgi:hypothetical protein
MNKLPSLRLLVLKLYVFSQKVTKVKQGVYFTYYINLNFLDIGEIDFSRPITINIK